MNIDKKGRKNSEHVNFITYVKKADIGKMPVFFIFKHLWGKFCLHLTKEKPIGD